jgi:hypothetical protein
MYFVDHQDERDSLQPVDMEELEEADRATTGPVLPKGPVIIIGAGPAGLAAAVSLKRNGIQTIVLEARGRWASMMLCCLVCDCCLALCSVGQVMHPLGLPASTASTCHSPHISALSQCKKCMLQSHCSMHVHLRHLSQL